MANTNILEELGLANLPQEEQVETALNIGRIIYQNTMLRVLDELKEEDKNEFDKFLENNMGDQDAIYGFLRSKIPNLDQIVSEETELFVKSSKNIINEAARKE